jgi:IS4 transposase
MPVLTIYEYSIQAALYKHRWKVEFFFKWIKQHLKIKSFGGTTENSVKTHVYIAVITYALVPIIWQRLKTAYTTYEVLILGSSLLDKTLINQLLEKSRDQDVKELLYNQLKIWQFKRDASEILSLFMMFF